MGKWLLGFVVMILAAAPPPATVTTCYAGRETRTSPDGKLPYGATPRVLKREVADLGARIVETTTESGRSPSMPPAISVRVLTRRAGSLVFDAVEDGGAFRGTVTFTDDRLDHWRCALQRQAGGSLTGTGSRSEAGIQTTCSLELPGSAMRLTVALQPVSQGEYDRRLAAMVPPPGAE